LRRIRSEQARRRGEKRAEITTIGPEKEEGRGKNEF
jgi:hypothetical protein